MKKLCFATHNANKLYEIQQQLADYPLEVIGLDNFPGHEAPEETEETLEGNARLKAEDVYLRYGISCFADDTGLEVVALDGAPGVRSARFAGENATYADNVAHLLEAMKGKANRNAKFRTVIALTLAQPKKTLFFEGVCHGQIIDTPRGAEGFGYDPVFIPEGETRTFAEMPLEEKNAISHRGRAVQALLSYLKAYLAESA